MSMPKGHKVSSGYSTVGELGGLDYRTISEKMSKNGPRMNHATARNVFLSAMEKFAKKMCSELDRPVSEIDISRIAKHPSFQEAVQEIMHDEEI